eukprot:6899090-Prymnesium_polylepis.1
MRAPRCSSSHAISSQWARPQWSAVCPAWSVQLMSAPLRRGAQRWHERTEAGHRSVRSEAAAGSLYEQHLRDVDPLAFDRSHQGSGTVAVAGRVDLAGVDQQLCSAHVTHEARRMQRRVTAPPASALRALRLVHPCGAVGGGGAAQAGACGGTRA